MDTERQKLCVLGVGGFIGSHLLKKLLDLDLYEIHGLDIASSKIEDYLDDPHFSFAKINVDDSEAVKRYVEAADTVISLVAICNPAEYNRIPLEVIDINFVRPLELVKMCASLGKRLIHFSTSEVYGKTIQGIVGDALVNPDDETHYILDEDRSPLIMGPVSAQRWSYAASKQLLERVIYALGQQGDLEYTIIRPLNFIGARMDYMPGVDGNGVPRVLACFMEALLYEKPLQIVDGGTARRTFTAIADAVDAIVRIIERREESRNQIFHIGNPNNECSMEELAHLMIDLYKELRPEFQNKHYDVISVPSEIFYGEGYEDCDRRVPDISKAQQRLGWYPTTDLRDAMRIAIASFIEYYGEKQQHLPNGVETVRQRHQTVLSDNVLGFENGRS